MRSVSTVGEINLGLSILWFGVSDWLDVSDSSVSLTSEEFSRVWLETDMLISAQISYQFGLKFRFNSLVELLIN